jgi:hypothetical protein
VGLDYWHRELRCHIIMKIYHYTTIESLALILKNKTLLFNRLDCVDDIEEGSVESLGIEVGKYCFVSCWTESSEESIPLWKMYAGNKMGVRIGLEQNMFKTYDVQNPTVGEKQLFGNMELNIPQEELGKQDYFILPLQSSAKGFFYRKVEYVDDVMAKTRDAIKIQTESNGQSNASIAFGEIGKYKHKRWAFQNETRFVLTILPCNPLLYPGDKVGYYVMTALAQNKQLGFTRYFMNLADDVVNNIEITLSPNASEGQQIIVDSLISQYAPNAVVKRSSLGHLVKF